MLKKQFSNFKKNLRRFHPDTKIPHIHRRRAVWVLSGLIVLTTIFVLATSPRPLPDKSVKVDIKRGETLPTVTADLYAARLIRSSTVFNALMRLSGTDKKIKTGIYLFSRPRNMVRLVWQLRTGDFGVKMIKVTIPEGVANDEMAAILRKALPDFQSADWLKKAAPLEGQLFPDTYYVSPLADNDHIIDQLHSAYDDKLKPLQLVIAASGHTENEILTMASLLEEEAKIYEAKKIISGILWKRLKEGMKLQVDAVFPYIMDKNSYNLTRADLQVNSPYNTYKYKGLPPAPITNPGMDSILAAIYPVNSPYYYYLSDKKGEMHYAATYAEHLKNKAKYLGG